MNTFNVFPKAESITRSAANVKCFLLNHLFYIIKKKMTFLIVIVIVV